MSCPYGIKGHLLLVCFCAAALVCADVSVSIAATCASDICRQIETIRQRHQANRYSFADPNYNIRVGQLLNTLDYYTAYFDSVRKYYPSQESFDATVEGLRLNYLNALNVIVGQAALTGSDSPSNNSGNAGSSAPNAQSGNTNEAGQRIIATLKNNHQYSWQFTPRNKNQGKPAKILHEGRKR